MTVDAAVGTAVGVTVDAAVGTADEIAAVGTTDGVAVGAVSLECQWVLLLA